MQVEAYKIVRSLLVETDEAAFDIMLKEALKMFDEKEETKEFKIYFEQTYSKRSEVWAYCHRKWYGINTNMHIESKVSSKISQLRKRHKVGQSLTSLCIESNEDEWSVSSTRANEEIVSRTLNMEPPNKKIKTQRYVSTKKKTSQKTSTTLRKPTQEECQSVSTSLVLTAKSV
ncbi:hypothetical protein TNCV_1036161 [Trichonephila clavipes]|nr:hypothetical protein TNCV_1036161 [Trichonephila clavipes]